MRYLQLTQNLMGHCRKRLIVFDEADSVLGTSMFGTSPRDELARASVIRLLEGIRLPTIWITNHAEGMHPALQRRFDLTVRFPKLPSVVRRSMLRNAMPEVGIDAQWLARTADRASVTPARIGQAERVSRMIAGDAAVERACVFRQVLDENTNASERHRSRCADEARKMFELPYRPELLNADDDLEAMGDAIGRWKQGRVCLYGPPGTGKTRFVRHLAERHGMEISEYRASDLFDMYLGNSEKAIRAMFEEASRNETLLFLDEADSLMRSRSNGGQAWETNIVNELLKGLEKFEGVFVASTNLMEHLDPAVLRRLDFKVHIGYLRREQRFELFLDLVQHCGVDTAEDMKQRARRALDRIDNLTPGDFAVVARRTAMEDRRFDAIELVERLEAEARIKPRAASMCGIGFTATLRQSKAH